MNASEKISNQPFKFELGQPVVYTDLGKLETGVIFARIKYDNSESEEENRYLLLSRFGYYLTYSFKESSLTLSENMPCYIPSNNISHYDCTSRAAWYSNLYDKAKVEVISEGMFNSLLDKNKTIPPSQVKSELQIKMALMECFCDVYTPPAYGADDYADLLASLQEAAQNGHDVYHTNGEKLQYTDEFFDLQEAMAKVESCLDLLQSYEQARAKII